MRTESEKNEKKNEDKDDDEEGKKIARIEPEKKVPRKHKTICHDTKPQTLRFAVAFCTCVFYTA